MDRRVKRMDWIDMGCVKAGAMLFALLAAKLWPPLLAVNPWVYAVALVLVSLRPVARFLSAEAV
jgi:hypothetical protein